MTTSECCLPQARPLLLRRPPLIFALLGLSTLVMLLLNVAIGSISFPLVMSVFSLIMPSSFQPSREKRKSPSTGLAVDAGRGLEVLQVLAALFPANRPEIAS